MAIKKNLKLVLSQDGSEPLVLESCWESDGEPEPLLLLDEHVQGTVRRRAICILLLLAKLPKRGEVGADGIIPFKDECKYSNWIRTLGDWKPKGAIREWVAKHFQTRSDQPLIDAHPGSKRGDRGRQTASAQYHSNILPVENLKIFTRSPSNESVPDRELFDIELLTTALKLEKWRWNPAGDKSCIRVMLESGKLRLPEKLSREVRRLGMGKSGFNLAGAENVADRQFESILIELQAATNTPGKTDEIMISQMRADYEEYYGRCRPFFSSVEEMRHPLRDSFETFTRFQAELFRNCCIDYISISAYYNGELFGFLKDEGNYNTHGILSSPVGGLSLLFINEIVHEPKLWSELLEAIDSIFEMFAGSYAIPNVKTGTSEPYYRRLDELQIIDWILMRRVPRTPYFVLGAVVAHRIAFSDLLKSLNEGLLEPIQKNTTALNGFLNNISKIASQPFWLRQAGEHLMYRNSEAQMDFLKGFREMLKAHAEFWEEVDVEMQKLTVT